MQPRYQHIKDQIISEIRTGKLTPGNRVSSENQLSTNFGVSRMTANRALRELTQEGWVKRIAGLGSFVAEPPRRSSLIEIRNIADEIAARNNTHSAEILSFKTIKANKELATEMELEVAAEVYYIRLVHLENDIPVQLEERCVNPVMAADFIKQDFTKTTPTAYLVATIAADEIEHSVMAAMPTAQQARWLSIDHQQPCLNLVRRSWSNETLVTLATFIYPASRYALYGRNTLRNGDQQ